MKPRSVAVVTGGNRGLGRETCRQLAAKGYAVVLAARKLKAAQAAVEELVSATETEVALEAFALDVTSSEQVLALSRVIGDRFGRLDALVNNAGAMFDDRAHSGILATEPEVLLRSFDTNTVGAFRLTRALLPLVIEARGCVVNVSSGMGGITEMNGGYTGYRLSKAAMNALTRVVHAEVGHLGVRVNSVCPGWVRTEMGGPGAERDIPTGAAGIVWAATLGADGPSGGFFRDGKPIPW